MKLLERKDIQSKKGEQYDSVLYVFDIDDKNAKNYTFNDYGTLTAALIEMDGGCSCRSIYCYDKDGIATHKENLVQLSKTVEYWDDLDEYKNPKNVDISVIYDSGCFDTQIKVIFESVNKKMYLLFNKKEYERITKNLPEQELDYFVDPVIALLEDCIDTNQIISKRNGETYTTVHPGKA